MTGLRGTFARVAGGTALTVALAGSLVACGADGSGETDTAADYCSTLEDASTEFEDLQGGDVDGDTAGQMFDRLHELADQTPDEVAADWETFDGAFRDLETAMDEAGLSFDDLAAAQGGQLPDGVTQQDLQKVGEAAQGLNNEEFTAASEAIEKHAKDECDVDLSS